MVLNDLKEPNFGRCGDTNLIQTGHPRYWITFCCPGLETTIMRRPGFYYGVYLVLPAQKQQSTSIQPMILRYFDLILGLRKKTSKKRLLPMVSPNDLQRANVFGAPGIASQGPSARAPSGVNGATDSRYAMVKLYS